MLAARLLCQMNLTVSDIELVDCLLTQFCSQVEVLYWPDFITPNMHLHCHLKDCVLDYGPVHNFWLFTYERYNGILENFPTNHHSIKTQLMKRFLREFSLASPSSLSTEDFEEFHELVSTKFEPHLEGSLKVTIHGRYVEQMNLTTIKDWSTLSINSELRLPTVYKRASLSDTSILQLQTIYSLLYPDFQLNDCLNVTFRKYSSLTYRGTHLNSYIRPIVYARDKTRMEARAVILECFFLYSLHFKGEVQQHNYVCSSNLA